MRGGGKKKVSRRQGNLDRHLREFLSREKKVKVGKEKWGGGEFEGEVGGNSLIREERKIPFTYWEG